MPPRLQSSVVAVVAAVAALLVACAGSGAGGAMDGSAGGDGAAGPSAEFVSIYDTIIAPNCGGSNCHLPGTNQDNYFGFRAQLQMPDAATAYARLVNLPVQCMSGPDARIRVVPLQPAMSAIMRVDDDGLCTRRHNVVLPPSFTAGDLARIEGWILAGAR